MLLDHHISNNGVIYYGPSDNNWTSFNSLYGPLLNGTPANRSTILPGASLTNVQVTMGAPFTHIQDWVANFSTQGWLSKLSVYSFDEPHTAANFSTVINNGLLIHATAPPGIALVTTNLANATANSALTSINIMVPIIQDMEP
jgi:hypothetical protein